MRKTLIKLMYLKLKYETLKLKNLFSDNFISCLDVRKIEKVRKYYSIEYLHVRTDARLIMER